MMESNEASELLRFESVGSLGDGGLGSTAWVGAVLPNNASSSRSVSTTGLLRFPIPIDLRSSNNSSMSIEFVRGVMLDRAIFGEASPTDFSICNGIELVRSFDEWDGIFLGGSVDQCGTAGPGSTISFSVSKSSCDGSNVFFCFDILGDNGASANGSVIRGGSVKPPVLIGAGRASFGGRWTG